MMKWKMFGKNCKSEPWLIASAIRNSNFLVLFPPVDKPVQSSLLIQISALPIFSVSLGRNSIGVFIWPNFILGNLPKFILLPFLYQYSSFRYFCSLTSAESACPSIPSNLEILAVASARRLNDPRSAFCQVTTFMNL